MSRFQFGLESLRRIRDGIARQEEVRLACLFAERNQLQGARETIEARRRHEEKAWEESALAGALGVELRIMPELQQRWKESEREIEAAIAVVNEQIKRQKECWVGAKRGVEELRQLEEESRRRWEVAMARREQALADEQFLARTLRGDL